jgi:hypothetical protein
LRLVHAKATSQVTLTELSIHASSDEQTADAGSPCAISWPYSRVEGVAHD